MTNWLVGLFIYRSIDCLIYLFMYILIMFPVASAGETEKTFENGPASFNFHFIPTWIFMTVIGLVTLLLGGIVLLVMRRGNSELISFKLNVILLNQIRLCLS